MILEQHEVKFSFNSESESASCRCGETFCCTSTEALDLGYVGSRDAVDTWTRHHLEARRGDWMQTFTGKAFWPYDPRPDDISEVDIAHSLAMQCRFAGHSRVFYSVAEHCLHMSYAVPAELALWGLLHDSAEAYLQDVVRPIKRQIVNYRTAEERVLRMIAARFGLSWPMPTEVKTADSRMLITERNSIMAVPPSDWVEELLEPLPDTVPVGYDPATAELMYRDRLRYLTQGR